jgi:D-alanyl-D-alanine carboxypeptidase/D-alanyl-D-alanine-endopeptidase (penicillin-binding protein 4)
VWVSVVTALLLVASIAAVLVVRPGPVGALLGDAVPSPSAKPSPRPPAAVLATASDAPVPTATGISAAIDDLAGDSRLGHLSASVVDLRTGEQLYERNSTDPVIPASVTKLVTAAAVLSVRGPSYRLATRAVAGSQPGEVVLVGGGDPTLAVDGGDTYAGAARLDQLAAQVKKALGGKKPTKVLVDASIFSGPTAGPGWDADLANTGYAGFITGLMVNGGRIDPEQRAPRSTQPELAAGREFARLLGVPGESVVTGEAGEGATELGVVKSPPLIRLVEMMLLDSDNVIAEALARQVALARHEEPTFEGAARATAAVIGKLGLPAEQLSLADGSGLSERDKLTTSLLSSLLTYAAKPQHPELAGLFSGLPVAGYSGTLDDRFGKDSTAAGLVRAKTGTLNGVSALAGIVVDADGRLLGFSLIANQVPGGPAAAEAALDQIAAKLTACGCR